MEELGLYIMWAIYSIAGILHFIVPKPYVKTMPRSIPYPKAMVYISGFFELLFGIALLFEATRSYAAIGLILLLIAFILQIFIWRSGCMKNKARTDGLLISGYPFSLF